MHFTKDSFVSGDAFYYTSDGKTVCLPLGTITVQESKAPAGYQLNPTVFVQKITGDGKQEMVSVYQSSTIEESVIRGGVKIRNVTARPEKQNRRVLPLWKVLSLRSLR